MDFEDYEKGPSNQGLKEVGALVTNLLDLQAEKKAMDDATEALGKRLRALQEVTLPETMDSHGMKDFTTTDGVKVTIKDVVRASIAIANKDEAHTWLRDNGHGPLIKRTLNAKFGKGEDALADKIKAYIEKEAGQVPDDKAAVHPGTLSAMVKEQLGQGADIPMDLLGVFLGRKAEVKGAK